MPPKKQKPAAEPKFVSNSLLGARDIFPRELRNAQVLLGENYVLRPKTREIIGSLLDSHFYHLLVAENTQPAVLCALMELDEEEWNRLSIWVSQWFMRQDFEDAKREVWRVMLLGEARWELPWIEQYENGWPLEVAWDRAKGRFSQMCRQVDSSPLLTNIPRGY